MALKYSEYSLVASPINVQKAFPGNIGVGISRDADAKSRKKLTKIGNPFIGLTCTLF